MAMASPSTQCVEDCVTRFETAWRGGQTPAFDEFLPADPDARAAALAELIYTDLEYRARAGEDVRIESYLERFPELAADREVVLDLIAAEHECRHRRAGPAIEEYLERFPDFRAELAMAEEPRLRWGHRNSDPGSVDSSAREPRQSPEKPVTRLGVDAVS